MKIASIAVLLVCCLISAALANADARPPITASAVTDGATHWRTIELRYVAPHVMAWWLDPAHQPAPYEYAIGDKIAAETTVNPVLKNAASGFRLPTGVETVVPIDSRKCLLVRGTEAGLRSLRKEIRAMDKPAQLFKVNSLLVDVNLVDLPLLGLHGTDDWVELIRSPFEHDKNIVADTNHTKVRVDFGLRDQIDTLVKDGSATILFDHSATIPANMSNETGCTVIDGKVIPMNPTAVDFRYNTSPAGPGIPTTYKVFVVPAMNFDKSIRVRLNLFGSDEDPDIHPDGAVRPEARNNSLASTVTIKKGYNIIVDCGLGRGMIIDKFGEPARPVKRAILFITVEPVPGNDSDGR